MNPGEWSLTHVVSNVFQPSSNPLETVLRCVIVYCFLVVGLRLAGKRQMGQMTVTDLVILLVLSNAVQNAMIGSDTSLTAGLVAAATLLIVNWAMDRLELRSHRLRHVLMGEPSLLVHDGRLVQSHLEREGISPQQVMAAIREHGVESLEHVKSAVLEVDGSISIIASDEPMTHKPKRIRFLRHT